ncbi:hypothetical protein WJX72_006944 [[Myrmecia] bisecta]|uniref:Glycosyltransferase 2-like domain-containing protein n=1 Tax=[Myrmecia] bisecta TaxID=41462 RepID=A0AAW1Q7H3_9CHLO
MTAVECITALHYAIRHVFRLKGLSFYCKLQISLLKVVAVVGYHYGKFLTIRRHHDETKPLPKFFSAQDRVHKIVGGHWVSASQFTNGRYSRAALDPNTVAVVVPVYAQSAEYLVLVSKTLERLARQTRLPNLIVLVDDASPVPVPDSFASDTVVVLRAAFNAGPASARNAGVHVAKAFGARYICYLDADCIPAADWICQMLVAQAAHPGIICGRTTSTQPETLVGLYHDICGTLNGRVLEDESILYGCTCNLAVDIKVVQFDFDTGFPGAAFEDVEYCVRARKQGISLRYVKEAVVQHHYECDCRGLFKQFQRYGSYEHLMCKRHPDYLTWLWASTEISSVLEGHVFNR